MDGKFLAENPDSTVVFLYKTFQTAIRLLRKACVKVGKVKGYSGHLLNGCLTRLLGPIRDKHLQRNIHGVIVKGMVQSSNNQMIHHPLKRFVAIGLPGLNRPWILVLNNGFLVCWYILFPPAELFKDPGRCTKYPFGWLTSTILRLSVPPW